jgi:carbonic anhydrase
LQQVNETSEGQYPFAFVLSCIDSRTSAELIFDQGLGDIFSCRIAGNILNTDIVGSMEFACKISGSKIIVVLGHTKCGAIKGACANVELGNLTGLLSKIKPAIEAEGLRMNDATSVTPSFVENVAHQNIRLTLKQIPKQSPILAKMIEDGEILLIGAIYNVETGRVDFFEDEMITAE